MVSNIEPSVTHDKHSYLVAQILHLVDLRECADTMNFIEFRNNVVVSENSEFYVVCHCEYQ